MGVRFISVNDNYDSENADVNDTHLIPIKTLSMIVIAEIYPWKWKALRPKDRRIYRAFAPYGYKKNSKKKNHLVVDRNVSHVIRKIFEIK